jgi:hypothetical protein
MARSEDVKAGALVFLTVGCGIALQLFLIRQAAILIHLTAAFPVLAAHIAGWGIGLGLRRAPSTGPHRSALVAAGAGCVAWVGTVASTTPGFLGAIQLGTWGIVPTALGSGVLTGLSIAGALAACGNPMAALAADLGGIGLGAVSHVALTALCPALPAPMLWFALLALAGAGRSLVVSLLTAALGATLIVPLDRPDRLARAQTPLGKALQKRGLDAWQGSFYDSDGRVDALADRERGGLELFINGGTQAQTPLANPDRVTTEIVKLLQPRSASVLGAGGMADVASLLEAGVERVVAVERSEAVLRAARATSPSAERIFADGRVRVIQGEARRFITGTRERFDLVLLPLAYGSAGVSPAALLFFPSYVFTIEGIAALGEAATDDGAVCFVLPTVELRDRVLSSLGKIERRRHRTNSLPTRLWVVENPRSSAYSEAVCWAPHGPLSAPGSASGLTLLHHPAWPASSALTRRLEAIEALPPVADSRPYFFDLFSPRHAWSELPPFLSRLFLWTPVGLLSMALLFLWQRGTPRRSTSPRLDELAIAALTGMAFPCLEYVVLSIARGAGFSEGNAYAVLGLTFAGAGFVAMAPRASLPVRAALSLVAMLGAAALFQLGGISRLFALPPAAARAAGTVLMAAVMTAGVAPFTGLFRAVRRRAPHDADVRQLFVASALGTLAATAPVLLVELRWGGPGSALVGGLAYALALAVALLASVSRADRTPR